MADELMTLDDMADGKLDLKTIAIYTSGDENVVNEPRLAPGVNVGSLAALNKHVKDKVDLQIATLPSGRKGYATLALAQAAQASLPANTIVEVHNDSDNTKNGVYTWDGATLTKSNNDVLGQAKSYTNTIANTKVSADLVQTNTSQAVLAVIATADDKTLAHFDSNGDMFLAGETTSVQNQLAATPKNTPFGAVAHSLDDANGQSLLMVLDNGGVLLAGDESTLQTQLAYAKSSAKLANIVSMLDTDNKTRLRQLLTDYGDNGEIVRNTRIDSFYDGSTTNKKRIPAIIKTSYGLLYMYNEQTSTAYDGDNAGARLCMRQVYLDSSYKVTKVSEKVILQSPTNDNGLVKHPMLGRASNGNIVLVYDVKESTPNDYSHFVRISTDDGLSFGTPVEIVKPSNLTDINVANGSSGTIAVLSTGRLVCPMYYSNNLICIYSNDNGVTWQWGSNLGGGSGVSINESAITVDENDVLYLSVREQSTYKKLIFKSNDGGQTLVSQGINNDLTSSICNSTILYDLKDKIIIHGTPTNESVTIRNRYRLAISLDKAVTFPIKIKLFSDNLYVGYSNLIKLSDGIYALAYEGDVVATGVNLNENVNLLIINLSGVLSNVSYS